MEWVLVYLPASDAPPKSVPRDHFDLTLKGKGFRLVDDDDDAGFPTGTNTEQTRPEEEDGE